MGARRPALVVVDIQYDFLPGGSLGVPRGDEVIARANRAIEMFQRRGLPIVFTRDWHPPVTKHFKPYGGAWPPHCVQGTKGARFHAALVVPGDAVIVSKGMDPEQDSYSGFQALTPNGRDFESVIHDLGVDRIYLCGLATDYCVRATALDARRRGMRVEVLEDAVRGVDVKPGDSEAAEREMREAGVSFTRTQGLARRLPPL